MVTLIILPSFPLVPTVAQTATVLLTQIILPTAPSMKEENIQPTMMAWILASLEMDLKPLLMEYMPPLSFNMSMTIIAPVIVTKTSMELSIPLNEYAKTDNQPIFQKMRPNIHAKVQATGSDIFAGILKAIIKTKQTRIGKNANIGNRIASIFSKLF